MSQGFYFLFVFCPQVMALQLILQFFIYYLHVSLDSTLWDYTYTSNLKRTMVIGPYFFLHLIESMTHFYPNLRSTVPNNAWAPFETYLKSGYCMWAPCLVIWKNLTWWAGTVPCHLASKPECNLWSMSFLNINKPGCPHHRFTVVLVSFLFFFCRHFLPLSLSCSSLQQICFSNKSFCTDGSLVLSLW